jgi:hypothetical protein
MIAVLLWALLAGPAPQSTAAVGSKPLVSSLFISRDTDVGPAFVVECRNTTGSPVSSGSEVWVVSRSSLKVDGTSLDEPTGGRIGVGLTTEVPRDGIWRGIIELPQSSSRRGSEVALGALVRVPVVVPLAAGRHTIAVRCNGIWSDDLVFYWEK